LWLWVWEISESVCSPLRKQTELKERESGRGSGSPEGNARRQRSCERWSCFVIEKYECVCLLHILQNFDVSFCAESCCSLLLIVMMCRRLNFLRETVVGAANCSNSRVLKFVRRFCLLRCVMNAGLLLLLRKECRKGCGQRLLSLTSCNVAIDVNWWKRF